LNNTTAIYIPLLNPNEPEALITELPVENGQQIKQGDPICTLETTKSTSEMVAEREGFITGLQYEQGQFAPAGEILCYIAETPTWTPPSGKSPMEAISLVGENTQKEQPSILKELRITQPAKDLAIQRGLDLRLLPKDQLVTRNIVVHILKNQYEEKDSIEREFKIPDYEPSQNGFNSAPVIVYGGGGHGKAVIEMLQTLDHYHVVGLLDDAINPGKIIIGVPVLGGENVLGKVYEQGIDQAINAVGGIGNIAIRVKVFERLIKANFRCPTIVHPKAFIESSASLSDGVQVFPHAYIGSEAQIGFGCIVNTGAIISHECVLGDYANISPGVVLAGEVHISSRVLIGMGVTINLGVRIGAGARIGNGATIKSNVPKNSIVKSGEIWPD
jgi:sugar O-acyltransferase (sialic acid O-acetyltransferase NeuD family)